MKGKTISQDIEKAAYNFGDSILRVNQDSYFNPTRLFETL